MTDDETLIEAEVVDETGGELVRVEPPVVSPEALIQRAIDANVPVETLEKLLDMRRVLKEESAKGQFFLALAKFQDECPSIEKQVGVEGRYSYAPIEHIAKVIRPLLTKHEFSYTFDSDFREIGKMMMQRVTCTLHHSAGHSHSSVFTAPIPPTNKLINVTQTAASALSYGKRYALCDVLGLTVGKDIDGYVPPEHGAPGDNASAPAATTRGQQREVSADEAKNLFLDWRTYQRQIEADASDEAWLAWFIEATEMPENIARNSATWSAADFTTACRKFDEMAPGLRQ